jgi:hypothetical protein
VAKNNQKKEKALRNRENARKYRKKTGPTRRFGSGRPGGGFGPRPAGSPDGVAPADDDAVKV